MRSLTLLLVVAALCPLWAESAHPTPADPNHVHGHTDNGVGSGGHDNGVAGMHAPKTVTVLPLDQVPVADDPGTFSAWSGDAVGEGHGQSSSGTWTTSENGRTHQPPLVAPWSRLALTTPTTGSAIVLVNGWACDTHVDLTGTVSINGGVPIAVAGWRWGTAAVVPVPAGVVVKTVEYTAKVVPGGGSSGVKTMFLWP